MSTVRYIKEHYTDLNCSNSQEELITNLPSQTMILDPSNIALRNLKHTDDFIQQMKRRLSLLHVQDEKNKKKARQNERKLQFHSKVRQSAEWELKQKQKYKKKVSKELGMSKSRISIERKRRIENIKAGKNEVLESKREEHDQVKEKSEVIDKSIQKMKQEEKQEKAERRKKINEMEKQQRQHIQEYFIRKRSSFRENSARQSDEYKTKKTQKEILLAELADMEKAMIYRQSSSRAALDETRKRLDKIKVKANKLSTRDKSSDNLSEKLPSLTQRENVNNPQYF